MWDLFLRLFQKVDREYYENNSPELPVESHSQPTPEKSIGEYKILQGQNQVVEGGKRWSTEWLLSEYVKNTDELIGKIDGTIPLEDQDVYVNTEDGLKKESRDLPPPDKVIYLDKSARPIEWEVKELWDTLARVPGTPYEEGQVPKRPDSFFLNIDKEDWLRRMGVEQKDIQDASDVAIDYDSIPHEEISRLRALFATSRRKGQEDNTAHPPINEDNLEEAWERETIFDGQHVMVVDEVMSSGQTLDISKRLLTMAFPEATFSGQHWARPKRLSLGADRQGKMQFQTEWVPVWYSEEMASGRGIGDRNPQWAEIGEEHNKQIGKHEVNYRASRVSKVGKAVLSTPHHDPSTFALTKDTRADSLREDFKQMAADLKNGRILYRPSAERDDFEDRIEAINQMGFKDWQKKREALEPKSLP